MDTELLYTMAQVAVAFAGFSGLAVVLRRSEPGGLSPHALRTLWYLVIDCLAVAFLAFLPVVLQQFGSEPGRLWALSNGVLGLTHLVLLSPATLWFARSFGQVRAEWQPLVSPLQSSLIAWSALIGTAQLLAAFGVGLAATPGLYTVGLLALLFFAAVDFVFLVAGEDGVASDLPGPRSPAGAGNGGGQASIAAAAPQLLVGDLGAALAFYRDRLGFATDFVYGDFYASVSRGGARIHLKCAPKLEAERAHRRQGEHLDAFLDVAGVRALHDELAARGVALRKPLEQRPWGALDFYVEDPDGYILCFSESA